VINQTYPQKKTGCLTDYEQGSDQTASTFVPLKETGYLTDYKQGGDQTASTFVSLKETGYLTDYNQGGDQTASILVPSNMQTAKPRRITIRGNLVQND
jgi:hypothetical protein